MRLIDAEVLEDYLDWSKGQNLLCVTRTEIRKTPTVDAQPVVHAKWIKYEDTILYWYVCSNCKEDIPHDNYRNWMFSGYCPHCGAKMDLE